MSKYKTRLYRLLSVYVLISWIAELLIWWGLGSQAATGFSGLLVMLPIAVVVIVSLP